VRGCALQDRRGEKKQAGHVNGPGALLIQLKRVHKPARQVGGGGGRKNRGSGGRAKGGGRRGRKRDSKGCSQYLSSQRNKNGNTRLTQQETKRGSMKQTNEGNIPRTEKGKKTTQHGRRRGGGRSKTRADSAGIGGKKGDEKERKRGGKKACRTQKGRY